MVETLYIVDSINLEYKDTLNNSDKIYNLYLLENNTILAHWGRRSTTGQIRRWDLHDKHKAKEMLTTKCNEKRTKGYTVSSQEYPINNINLILDDSKHRVGGVKFQISFDEKLCGVEEDTEYLKEEDFLIALVSEIVSQMIVDNKKTVNHFIDQLDVYNVEDNDELEIAMFSVYNIVADRNARHLIGEFCKYLFGSDPRVNPQLSI